MSQIITLADALVNEINAASLSQTVEAQRHYKPTFNLENNSELVVAIVPRSHSKELLSRASTIQDFSIDVGVMMKITDDADADALINLVEEIRNLFEFTKIEGFTWVGDSNDPIFEPDHIEQLSQFTSVVTVNFRKGS